MRGWPEEVIAWLRENVPGRTTKQVTELINQQGFDKKYGMVFSDAVIKNAKNRYGIKSGTNGGFPKGSLPNIRKEWKVTFGALRQGERRRRLQNWCQHILE